MAISFTRSPPTPADFSGGLRMPKGVTACDGEDITKKSGMRKSRYLLSFPGIFSELTGGGTAGTLKDMDTPNPSFVMDLPQGTLTLRGSIKYSRAKFVTLQCPDKAGPVACEDVFDAILVFDVAEWSSVDGHPPPPAVTAAESNVL